MASGQIYHVASVIRWSEGSNSQSDQLVRVIRRPELSGRQNDQVAVIRVLCSESAFFSFNSANKNCDLVSGQYYITIETKHLKKKAFYYNIQASLTVGNG